jgi:hypothetical protein
MIMPSPQTYRHVAIPLRDVQIRVSVSLRQALYFVLHSYAGLWELNFRFPRKELYLFTKGGTLQLT